MTQPSTSPAASNKLTSTSTPRPTSPSTRLITPALDTAGLSAPEIKDRQAIQIAWVKYWDIYVAIDAMPVANRAALLATVTVDPIRAQILTAETKSDAEGEGTYGNVSHRFYWGTAVAGKNIATVGDCMDTSHYGSLILKTKKKITKGYARDNAQGAFVRSESGSWKLQNIFWLVDTVC